MAAHGDRAPQARTRVNGSRGRTTAAPAEREGAARGLLRALAQGLSIGLLLVVLGIGVLAVGIPAAFGATPYSVLTGSMIPTYPPGTLIVTRPTPVDEIRIGDALTYQIESGNPAVVTHRVIEIVQDSNGGDPQFITQGDANPAPDSPPVKPVQIKGTVWYAIPWLGYANQWVNGDARKIVIPVIVAALFAYAAWMVLSGIRDRARKRRENGAADSGGNPDPAEAEDRDDPDDGAEGEDR